MKIEGEEMPEKKEKVEDEEKGTKEKVEDAAEKTGETVGKGLKEGAKIVKRAGQGLKKELKKV